MGTSKTTLCLLPVARHSVGRSGGHLGRALESITYSSTSQPFLIYFNIIKKNTGVPLQSSGLKGSGIVTAAVWVTAVTQVQSLAQELPHAPGIAKNKKLCFPLVFGISK